MSVFHPKAACFLLLVSAVLAGCSRHEPSPAQATRSPYVAVARGRVDVEGGLLALAAPGDGTVASVAVHEGDHVRPHQTLATLDGTAHHITLDAATAQLQQAMAHQQLVKVQWRAASDRAHRLRQAADAGAGTGASADDAATQVRRLAAESDAAAAAVAVARSNRDAAQYAVARDTLRSPLDADVVTVQVQPGATVTPQSPALFVLLPRRARIVRAELNTAYAGAVHAGMHALVGLDDDDDARPLQATVLRVGQVVGPSTLEDDPELKSATRTVQCVLALPAGSHLLMGQRVLVRFLPDGAQRPAGATAPGPAHAPKGS